MSKTPKTTSKTAKNPGGFVRLTGGAFKGQKIFTPGGNTHPMGERERLALFNMLKDVIEINKDIYILDAFAGGGTLGFEAVSRGARDVIFFDKSPVACKTIMKNGEKLGFPYDYCGFQTNLQEFLYFATDRFDLIFVDPPYNEFTPKIIDDLKGVLIIGGVMVVSHPGKPTEIDGLEIIKSKTYAAATITIYRNVDIFSSFDEDSFEDFYAMMHAYD